MSISPLTGDSHDTFIRDGYTYKPFGVHVADYAVFVEGTDAASKYSSILAISLSSIKQYYDKNMTETISLKTSS